MTRREGLRKLLDALPVLKRLAADDLVMKPPLFTSTPFTQMRNELRVIADETGLDLPDYTMLLANAAPNTFDVYEQRARLEIERELTKL